MEFFIYKLYKTKTYFMTLPPPLLKARLEAQAQYESQQTFEEISRAMVMRKGLEMYLRENKLPEGYLEDYIKKNYSEEEQETLFELLEKQKARNDELYT